MGTVITPFYSLECNGPAPTPAFKHCPSVAKGAGWDQSETEAAALTAGWVFDGKRTLCPMCAPAEVPSPKPARKPSAKVQPVPDASFPQGGGQ